MILEVSPTRMELLKLKKKLVIAKRGHKLLKDKLDEFIRILFLHVEEVEKLKKMMERSFFESRKLMAFAEMENIPEVLMEALSFGGRKWEILVEYDQLLNLKVPRYKDLGNPLKRNYGFVQTSKGLDLALLKFDKVTNIMLELIAKEKSIYMIVEEIEKTKRRVNVLEYILIPNVEDTIKFITMKMEEHERNNLIQLMRIKDVVRVPLAHTSAHPGLKSFPF